ncbi:DUF4236 domain-containing protein [Bacillus sp. FJAT-45350]|uniref:DUF4236 domain-containing protein n=1 Tax=Bacillus sp. FJAT-45350 TaxID=2011014 RepID=UPI0015CC5AC0|nr:DUF4236 domain-containing protein [Bacillus sp. FJAT-45350]
MSFRFQKRVKVAPGVRINISKRGVSTSIGRRGASATLGKRGLYGNIGMPGSGLSYRTRLDKKSGRKTIQMTNGNNDSPAGNIQLVYQKDTHSVAFVTDNGKPLPSSLERQLKKEFSSDIEKLYREKEQEINAQTDRLLDLHHQTFKPTSYQDLDREIDEITAFNEREPLQEEIYREMLESERKQLHTMTKLLLLLPSKKKEFEERINEQSTKAYKEQLTQYQEDKAALEDEKEYRKGLLSRVGQGDMEAIEQWLELYLPELDFPLETNVSFSVLSKETIYLDVDLPEMKDIPLTKAEILKSGKLKVKEKSQRETREHFALVVGGTALYLCSFVFAYVPSCKNIVISGFTQILNEATGHTEDQYIYSLVVDRTTLFELNMEHLHPVVAFDNFKPKINATKTYIFKEIKPYQPEDFS